MEEFLSRLLGGLGCIYKNKEKWDLTLGCFQLYDPHSRLLGVLCWICKTQI